MKIIYQITKKGQEIPPFTISRSNKYFAYFLFTLLLGDYDPDKAMPEHMILKSLQDFYNVLCLILPPEFNKIECLIGSGSSNGIKNSSGELVYDSGSMHAYWINSNVNEENIEKLIEYIKRACILHNLYYLKIFKDGSTGLRFQIDLAVLKSALSRLVFESKPTCKDGLYQDRPQSLIWNLNSQETLDLSKITYDHLPDWKPVYERLKIENRELIQQTKEAYKTSKIDELIQKGVDGVVATNMVVKYIEESVLSVKFYVEDEFNSKPILHLLTQTNKSIYLKDPIEPFSGSMKAVLNTGHLFDAEIFSYLHGGKNYKLSFDIDDIYEVLTMHKDSIDIEKIIVALSVYSIFSKKDIKILKQVSSKILEITKNSELVEIFEKEYDKQFLEEKTFDYMKDYAFISNGGKIGFIAKDKTILEVYSKADLKIKFENKRITAPFSKKVYNPVDVFTSSTNREEYNSIVFKNPEDVKPHEYNLFKGWKYQPVKSVDTSFFWDFVKKVIANDVELIFCVICSWLADIIQNPFSKSGTALVIIGEKGTGKGTFVKIFGSLLDIYFMESADPKRIFSSFNHHLQNCLLLYGNEAFWSGQKSDESKLKSIVTDIDYSYEIKGSLTYKGENYTHLILDSNSDHVVSSSYDERRWINTYTSSIYRGDFEFFEKFNELVKTKEFKESLMFDLMNFDYSPWKKYLRKAPITQASIDQLLYSLDLYEQWWFKTLENGDFGDCINSHDSDNSIRISNEALEKSFKNFVQENHKRNYDSTPTFIKAIKKRFLHDDLIISETIKSIDGKNAKIIASLDKCRAYFTSKYGLEIKSIITQWQIKTVPSYLQQGGFRNDN